jgi:hypothetical protein
LRKELRLMSKSLAATEGPAFIASRRSVDKKSSSSNSNFSDKENFRPAASALPSDSQWMRGGGVVAPAVFSFSGSSPAHSSFSDVADYGTPLSSSAAAAIHSATSVDDSRVNQQSTSGRGAAAALPRGFMVRFMFCACLTIDSFAANQLIRDCKRSYSTRCLVLFLAGCRVAGGQVYVYVYMYIVYSTYNYIIRCLSKFVFGLFAETRLYTARAALASSQPLIAHLAS